MIKFLSPYRDGQRIQPSCFCKHCGHELYQDSPIVTEDGQRMHLDCFEEYVLELLRTSPAIVADCLGMRYEEGN